MAAIVTNSHSFTSSSSGDDSKTFKSVRVDPQTILDFPPPTMTAVNQLPFASTLRDVRRHGNEGFQDDFTDEEMRSNIKILPLSVPRIMLCCPTGFKHVIVSGRPVRIVRVIRPGVLRIYITPPSVPNRTQSLVVAIAVTLLGMPTRLTR